MLSFLTTAMLCSAFSNDGPFVVAVVGTVGFFAAVIAWLTNRAKYRQRRLELIEQALRSGNLAPEAQAELARQLRPAAARGWLFSLGWLGAFGGIAWLCLEPRHDQYVAAVVVTVFSFACITLPVALRELESRRA